MAADQHGRPISSRLHVQMALLKNSLLVRTREDTGSLSHYVEHDGCHRNSWSWCFKGRESCCEVIMRQGGWAAEDTQYLGTCRDSLTFFCPPRPRPMGAQHVDRRGCPPK